VEGYQKWVGVAVDARHKSSWHLVSAGNIVELCNNVEAPTFLDDEYVRQRLIVFCLRYGIAEASAHRDAFRSIRLLEPGVLDFIPLIERWLDDLKDKPLNGILT
jgi:hypothetical protein